MPLFVLYSYMSIVPPGNPPDPPVNVAETGRICTNCQTCRLGKYGLRDRIFKNLKSFKICIGIRIANYISHFPSIAGSHCRRNGSVACRIGSREYHSILLSILPASAMYNYKSLILLWQDHRVGWYLRWELFRQHRIVLDLYLWILVLIPDLRLVSLNSC